ncbi:Sister chromatid cohesion 1 protein 3 [Citrus sinensis]|nr:Sister chromatid cohesion 1 protein 3 [Citrus sinensis]
MCPDVPIALRMSGHLLLGVVRIYSKKVDYLYHDCNVFLISLRKTFSTVSVNLPEDATHAPAHTVTLPQKFNLDSVDLDDHTFDDEYDNHLRSQEDITLTDQIPVGRDVYVAITFDEFQNHFDIYCSVVYSILRAPPSDADVGIQDPGPSNQTEVLNVTEDIQDPGASHQGELPTDSEGLQEPGPSNQTEVLGETVELQEPGPSNQTEVLRETVNFQEPDLSNQTEVLHRSTDHTSPPKFPEVEVMRDTHHDFSAGDLSPLFLDVAKDITEPIVSSHQFSNEKEIQTPALEDLLASRGQPLQFQQHTEPPASAFTPEVLGGSDTHVSCGYSSPALVIRSTPPEQQQNQRARKRIRLDKSLVLPNKFMKKALEDSSDLLRKKRNVPINNLGVWKLNNMVRKEQVFHEPLLTGSCVDICNIFKKNYISAKPHLVATAMEEGNSEPMIVDSPAPETEAIPEPSAAKSPHAAEDIQEPRVSESHASVPEIEMEIGQLRHDDSNIGNDYLPEFMPSPATVVHSPFTRDDQTHSSTKSFESESMPTGTHGSELETPRVLSEEWLSLETSGLSDIPELINSAEADLKIMVLSALICDEYDIRAVAQYLQRQSPITPSSEGSTDLSLNKILQGKTRKLCARMFFETLVLKSYGLLDVEQEQPYGDITLKLTPKLSKTDI